jgi:drug/metabolite transporter (DMT)-like permease
LRSLRSCRGYLIVWAAVPIFAAVGILYPAAVTLLTRRQRALGPVITSSLGNLAPLFAVGFAVVILGDRYSMPRSAACW